MLVKVFLIFLSLTAIIYYLYTNRYPTSTTFLLGLVAQGIEHRFPKPGVASSNLAEAAFFNYIYMCRVY